MYVARPPYHFLYFPYYHSIPVLQHLRQAHRPILQPSACSHLSLQAPSTNHFHFHFLDYHQPSPPHHHQFHHRCRRLHHPVVQQQASKQLHFFFPFARRFPAPPFWFPPLGLWLLLLPDPPVGSPSSDSSSRFSTGSVCPFSLPNKE